MINNNKIITSMGGMKNAYDIMVGKP